MEINGIFNNPTKFVPGPGKYYQEQSMEGVKYSFRPRTKDPNAYSSSDLTPGPGQYKSYNTINEFGRYVLSKLQNSKASNFNPPHSKRFSISSQYNFKSSTPTSTPDLAPMIIRPPNSNPTVAMPSKDTSIQK
jgi:hypothetical protein